MRTVKKTLKRITLVHGKGDEARMVGCMMTATAWRMGLRWSAVPSCTHLIIARAVIHLNDELPVVDLPDAFRLLGDPIVGTDTMSDIRAVWCVAGIAGRANMEVVAAFAGRLSDEITETDLSGAELRWADLRWADLSGADLSGANLAWANLYGTNLNGANINGANLCGAEASSLMVWPTGFDAAARGVVIV